MTTKYSTPHPPKGPLFLSPEELQACDDIDKNGIDMASRESLEKLAFLATCLATEVINFIKHYPSIKPAGLLLNVDVLHSVWEPVNEPAFNETDDGDDPGGGQ